MNDITPSLHLAFVEKGNCKNSTEVQTLGARHGRALARAQGFEKVHTLTNMCRTCIYLSVCVFTVEAHVAETNIKYK